MNDINDSYLFLTLYYPPFLKHEGLADKANQQIIPPSLSEHITNQKPEANSVNSNKKRKISSSPRTYANNLRKLTPVRRQKTATSIPASSQMSTEVSEHEDNFISVSMKSEEDLPENVWIPKVCNGYPCLSSFTIVKNSFSYIRKKHGLLPMMFSV